jgi:CubicO group peptidase (beta-lactamase class C family)
MLDQHVELDAFVADRAAALAIPGTSVGVLHRGKAYGSTHGVTSTADPLPVDADTLFMIGSTAKTITGTTLMRLVEEGRAALTDRVADHLEGFALADQRTADQVTLRHLLNHTGGWRGDALPRTGFGDDALARAMAVVAEGPQEFPLGAHASYNNAALMVAGRVIEVLTGTSYEEAAKELVLAPLGMTSTFFHPWEVANRRLAVGHLVQDGVAEPIPLWPTQRAISPPGGAICSLHDQLTYAAYHLDGSTSGTPPLKETTRLLMQQQTVAMRSTLTGIGLTWLLSEQSGVRLVSHGGNISNLQTSAFHLAPDHGLAVVVMTNSAGGAVLGQQVLAWCLEHLLGRPARQRLDVLPLEPELADEYTGRYDYGPWANEITLVDGELFTQRVLPEGTDPQVLALFAKPPTRLVLVGEDQVATADDPVEPVADFVRDADGRVRWLRTGMRMAART